MFFVWWICECVWEVWIFMLCVNESEVSLGHIYPLFSILDDSAFCCEKLLLLCQWNLDLVQTMYGHACLVMRPVLNLGTPINSTMSRSRSGRRFKFMSHGVLTRVWVFRYVLVYLNKMLSVPIARSAVLSSLPVGSKWTISSPHVSLVFCLGFRSVLGPYLRFLFVLNYVVEVRDKKNQRSVTYRLIRNLTNQIFIFSSHRIKQDRKRFDCLTQYFKVSLLIFCLCQKWRSVALLDEVQTPNFFFRI